MNYKKSIELIAGSLFLLVAIFHLAYDKPPIYIPAFIFGFMFLFQGINKLREK